MKWVLSEYDPEKLADIIICKLRDRYWYNCHIILDKKWEYWDSSGTQVLSIYSYRNHREYCTILAIYICKDYMILKSLGGSIYIISIDELESALKSNIENAK
jgi:hypothetical protein